MPTFLDLAQARRGHFQMESGLHCGTWFELDAVFANQTALDPFVTQLAQSLRRHDVEAVCGPLIGGAFLAQLVARLLGSEFYFTTPAPSDGKAPFSARYQLPAGIGHRLLGKRVALVDDVMSAGSSLRATLTAVELHGAIPVVIGALHVLGTAGADFFKERGLRVETTGRSPFDVWRQAECPLCSAGVPLDDPSRPAA
ncbi:MAG TPA: phosphoribosyltransferase family protein [Vicinamibacterales bacterium]|nr:phosphoribosyltransferase family protein [Vicinamibacterales bacterium]